MKKSLFPVYILICLLSWLSLPELKAQQYDVEVVLGTLECTGTTGVPITLSGTVGIGPGSGQGVAQTESFQATTLNNEVIFSRTFDYLPSTLTLTSDAFLAPPSYNCAAEAFNTSTGITANHNFVGYQTYNITNGHGETMELSVKFTQVAIGAGTIGYDQMVCAQEQPASIVEVYPPTGGGGSVFTYSWEYSDNGSSSWTSISGATDDYYQPPGESQDRWYRRGATLGGQTAYTDPVKMEIVTVNMDGYRIDFYLGDYKCNGTTTSADFNMTLNFTGSSFNDQGTSSNLISPVLNPEFAVRPVNVSLNASLISSSGSCVGGFGDLLTLPTTTGVLEAYTLTSGNATLDIHIQVTALTTPPVDAGVIGSDQTICPDSQPLALTESTPASGGIGGYEYIWEYSIDAGDNWTATGDITAVIAPGVLSVDTWYRRVVTSGCDTDITDPVIITMATPPVISFDGLEGPYEFDAAPVLLTGSPSGGVFVGNGISGNYFNPAAAGPGTHTITYVYDVGNGCSGTATAQVSVEAQALCTTVVPLSGNGAFTLDKFSGRIVYQKTADCSEDIVFSCINAAPAPPEIDNVIAASAVTLSDEWDYSSYYSSRYETPLTGANNFEQGLLGKWRSTSAYVYSTSALDRDKNYNTGTFTLPVFNWQYEDANAADQWILSSRVSKYSPHGEALEEYNAIGISSTVKMGYFDALPYLTAQNATYESVFFESFEQTYEGEFETGAVLDGTAAQDELVAHAGNASLMLAPSDAVTTQVMKVPDQQTSILVQGWIKAVPNQPLAATALSKGTNVIDSSPFTEIARSGEWGLYQALISTGTNTSFRMQISNTSAAAIWLDDLRVQPEYAEMTCYVYDTSTLRLLTIFDGQHFGLYYQYDGEGKLVRKMIETERGMKTLQETFYNVPKIDK